MKKIIVLIAIGVSLGLSASAQKKTGFVNSEELLGSMPEMQKAQEELTAYAKTFETEYATMSKEFETKFQEYSQKGNTMSEAMREIKEKELSDLRTRIQEFEVSAQEKIQKKRDDAFKPLMEKAQKAIKDVGTEGGYDYIFEGTTLLYFKEEENLLPQVKAKLGIK